LKNKRIYLVIWEKLRYIKIYVLSSYAISRDYCISWKCKNKGYEQWQIQFFFVVVFLSYYLVRICILVVKKKSKQRHNFPIFSIAWPISFYEMFEQKIFCWDVYTLIHAVICFMFLYYNTFFIYNTWEIWYS